MTTLTRPLGLTQTRQLLTFPASGYAPTVTAYLWGAGGGSGGSDAGRQGGAGTAGGYVRADFTATPGDTIEITVGSAGSSGVNSTPANAFLTPIFNTRTAIPIGATSALPVASRTNVARWSSFLNQTGVWNTGTAVDGTTTNLSRTLTFDQSYTVFFEISINYVFTLAAYYQATVYLDGELFIQSGLDSWKNENTLGLSFVSPIAPGNHTIRIIAEANPGAQYGTFGVGLTIAAAGNAGLGGGGLVRTIFDTRNTVASPPLFAPDPIIDSTNIYSNLMFDFGVWESNPTASSCSRTYTNVYFPYSGVYQVEMSAANTATLSIDGGVVATTTTNTYPWLQLDSYSTAFTTDVTVNQGYHTISFSASFSSTSLPSAGVAIRISKSWSGATGGLAGPKGSSGGGGGAGGCTTLVLNPGTINETLLAVAVGGAGGGGAGNSNGGISEATAPGPRGQTAAGISSPQVGQNQGDLYQDGGGGGAGGPGGPDGAGKNGFSSVGDAYAQAGSLGISYRNTGATIGGEVIAPSGVTPGGTNSAYYSLVPTAGVGATAAQLQAQHGAAVFVVDAYGIQVRDDAVDGNWHDVKTAFVNVNGVWRQTFAAFIYQNNAWEMVVGGAALTFTSAAGDYGRLSRPPDRRALPPPPPSVYDSAPNCCCFVAGTQITMADGSTKSIEDVGLGEVVLGKDGAHNTVLEFLRPTLGETGATLMAFNGGKPFMASDHPVYVRGQGWKSFDPAMTYSKYSITVGQYQVGDVIETLDGAGFELQSIEEYSDQDPDQTIYNFMLDGNNTYIAHNLVVHNKGGAGSCGGGASGGGGSAGCCCCFVAGTLVTMADGSYKCIEDVALGEVVLGKDGTHNTVLEFLRPTLGETGATLMAFNGGTPFMASDHPVWIRNEGWKSFDPAMTYDKYGIIVSQYKVGDTIETEDHAGFVIESIEEYNSQDPTQIIYNVKVTGNNTYVANRLVVHNKSDARLKRNIELIDTRNDGLKIYTFKYVWSDVTWVGVMAQDLLEQPQFAHAVQMDADGFYSVDYSKINFEMTMADQCVCLD
jgi:hypothetical protein